MSRRKISKNTAPFLANHVTGFRVEQTRPRGTEDYEANFATVAEAEKRARMMARRFGRDADILAVDITGRTEHVATALIDALDRCWIQVAAAPGQRTFL